VTSSYRDPILGRLDHDGDLGFDDPDSPDRDDPALDRDLRRDGDGRRFFRTPRDDQEFDAWLTGRAHRQARTTRLHDKNAARLDLHSGRAA
jgi:hypothetical protein